MNEHVGSSKMPKIPKQPKELIVLEQCRYQLSAMTDLKSVMELRDQATALKSYMKARGDARDSQNSAAHIAALAEARAGQLIKEGQKQGTIAKRGSENQHTKKKSAKGQDVTLQPKQLKDIGVNKKQSERLKLAAEVLEDDPDWFNKHEQECNDNGWDFTQQSILREGKKIRRERIGERPITSPKGKYDVVVIDPPWDMKRIEMEERPGDLEFDYPTMTEDELELLEIPSAENCHLWLWTTQRFLPMAFRLCASWEFKYVCMFVWKKTKGMQPIGLPYYNAEFVLYCRKGTPKFTTTKDFRVCNSWKKDSQRHSEKPEEFYDMVRRVTKGKRLDMFSRRKIKGFSNWGLEAEK